MRSRVVKVIYTESTSDRDVGRSEVYPMAACSTKRVRERVCD